MSEDSLREVRQLLDRLCADELSPSQCVRLAELLEVSEAAQELYLDYMNLHAGLCWQAALLKDPLLQDALLDAVLAEGNGTALPRRGLEEPALPASPPAGQGAGGAITARPVVLKLLNHASFVLKRPLLWSTLAVASIFYGSFVLLSSNLRPAPVAELDVPEPTTAEEPEYRPAVTVAHFTDVSRAVWAQGEPPARQNAPLKNGQVLDLSSGVAELTFASGARVAIEGPARLTLDSEKLTTLETGKLTANVPERAVGFSVQTPSMLIVDLGTTFGVEVAPEGDDQVHVFKGEVELQFRSPAEARDRQKPVRLRSGQALRINKQQPPTESFRADAGRFAATTSHTHVPAGVDLPIGADYVAAVKRSQPIGYWRFEEIVDQRYVRNEMSSEWPVRLGGAVRLGGPWGYRRAVFADDGVDRWMQVDAPIANLRGDFSIELFVKPARLQESELITLLIPASSAQQLPQFQGLPVPPDLDRFHTFVALELLPAEHTEFRAGTVRFLHRNPPGVKGGANVFSEARYQTGSWQHVTVVKSGIELRLYINGVLTGTGVTEKAQADLDPTLVLGRLYGEDMGYGSSDSRLFAGELDEVAVYPRALSRDEVEKHYRLSRSNEVNGAR